MTTTPVGTPALELRGVDLHYGFVRALDQVDIHVNPGEVVALLGDNGAGKSTLLKVMSGAHRPTHGTIRVHGAEHTFHAPSDAAGAGIQMVYQDLSLVEPQDISTNLNMGQETLRRGPLGWLGFVISGLLAALGGLVSTAVVTEASPSASPAIIFTALTAVALAGVSLTGGRGSLPRVLVGALILATISNGLTIRGIQPYWALVVTGALLLGSLMLERVLQTSVSERLMAANLSVHQKQG